MVSITTYHIIYKVTHYTINHTPLHHTPYTITPYTQYHYTIHVTPLHHTPYTLHHTPFPILSTRSEITHNAIKFQILRLFLLFMFTIRKIQIERTSFSTNEMLYTVHSHHSRSHVTQSHHSSNTITPFPLHHTPQHHYTITPVHYTIFLESLHHPRAVYIISTLFMYMPVPSQEPVIQWLSYVQVLQICFSFIF